MDMNDIRHPKTVPEMLEENAKTYRTKNADYGDSWRTAGKIIEMWMNQADVDEIVLPADANVINRFLLWGRRLDKDTRGFNGEFLADEMNHESTVDAHLDNSNYSTMHAKLLLDEEARDQAEREAMRRREIKDTHVGESVALAEAGECECETCEPMTDAEVEAELEELEELEAEFEADRRENNR